MIEVLQPGLLTTVQDGGRRGFEAYGVPRSGFFDPFLASIANHLVGNSLDVPLLEFAITGPTLHFDHDAIVSISGKKTEYDLEGNLMHSYRAFKVRAGETLRFRSFAGWFGYIAIRGGIESNTILGSASTYVAGKIGRRLEKGDILKFRPLQGRALALKQGYWNLTDERAVELLPAPHTHLFDSGIQHSIEHRFKITTQSNRMGIRLEGPVITAPIIRRSMPVLPGTVQVPRAGAPIILGPEGPTTGGYAQVGVISNMSWTVLAASRPGSEIRLKWINLESAKKALQSRKGLFLSTEAWEDV